MSTKSPKVEAAERHMKRVASRPKPHPDGNRKKRRAAKFIKVESTS